MSNEFQRDYLLRLPLPLAQLYARAHNAKDGRGRHDNCFYLCESAIKLAATPLIVNYLNEVRCGGSRVTKLDRLLVQLTLPSLGQWAGFLRELAKHFGSRPDAASHPFGHLWEQLNTKHQHLPGVLSLFQRIKNGPEGKTAGDRSCSFLQVIESLVQYRNAVFGHGAGRVASFYEDEMGPLLFPAVNEILAEGAIDLLGPRGSKLVYIVEIKTVDEDRIEVGMRELVGLQGERMAPLLLDAHQADRLLPNRVAVLWPGRKVPLPLDPILVYRENELTEDVLFLNRDRSGRQVEYLSYCTGQTERDKSMAPAMARMLSEITGNQVTESRLNELREMSLSESVSVEAIAETPSTSTRVLGDFEILMELGRGGMGVVYLARQSSLGRLVALKMLPADMAGDEVALARFRREMRALGRCEHPNIVKVLSSGTFPDGQLYYAMEYVPGTDLERAWHELADANLDDKAVTLGGTTWHRAVINASSKTRDRNLEKTKAIKLRQINHEVSATNDPASDSAPSEDSMLGGLVLPKLPELPTHEDDPGGFVRRVAMFVRDAGRALQAVHDQGIVHRDIKPANLMLTPDGSRVVLMDFGLAKGDAMSVTATHSAGFLGTLRYSAPEQLAAAQMKVGPQADIRALGITMWELLTRRRLFGDAEDERQLTSWVLTRDVPRLRTIDPTLDADLEAIVARATERGEENRLQSAREMADYLDLYLAGKSIPIRTPGLVELFKRWVREHAAVAASAVAALLIVAITVVVAFVLVTRERNDAIAARDDAVESEEQAREAEQKERAARKEADNSRKLASKAVFEMLAEVGAESLDDVPQVGDVRKSLLTKAEALYEQIGKTNSAKDEETRYQTAKAHFEVAQIHRQIGMGEDSSTAEDAYKNAISQFGALSSEFSNVARYQQELARSHMWLGELLREVTRYERAEEAEHHYCEAIKIQEKLATEAISDNRIQYQLDLGRSHMNRALNRFDMVDVSMRNSAKSDYSLDDAEKDYETAERLFAESLRGEISRTQKEECRVLLAKCHNNRGMLLRKLHKDAEPAKRAYRDAIAELTSVIEDRRQSNQPARQEYSLNLAKFHTNLANHLQDIDEAVLAVNIANELNVGTRAVRVELARFVMNKGILIYETDPDQAISDWNDAAGVLEGVLGQNAQDAEARELLVRNLYSICWIHQKLASHQEAIRTINRLADLPCEQATCEFFDKAADDMTKSRAALQAQSPELAEEYEKRIILLREKVQQEREKEQDKP